MHTTAGAVAETSLSVAYELLVGGEKAAVNQPLTLTFRKTSEARCQACEAPIQRRFGQGFCYDCFSSLARCDLCVVSPDRCHLHLGTCREPEWGASFCQQPHVVYLACSSGPKVGLTRADRVWRRWIDQGASQGMVLAEAPTRRAAGVLEAKLKQQVSDRTDWRKLVSGNHATAPLLELARQLKNWLPDMMTLSAECLPDEEKAELKWRSDSQLVNISYGMLDYAPAQMLRLSGSPEEFKGNLVGILGGYLLFQTGVLNIGELSGGDVEVTVTTGHDPVLQAPQLDLF